MLYLLGGPPRVGKSTTAAKFTAATGLPYFSIDYLKMALARGLPEFGLDPNGGDAKIARQLWPLLKGMTLTYLENEEDVLLEGTYFLPAYVAELRRDYGEHIRACFMGYGAIDTMEKIRQLRAYDGVNERGWTSADDGEAVAKAEFLKAFSESIKADCEQYGFKYFENSTDHWRTIDEVVGYLRA